MRLKVSDKQAKANKISRVKAMCAMDAKAIRDPAPDTWSARKPAYTYMDLCPVPELREPPKEARGYSETLLYR